MSCGEASVSTWGAILVLPTARRAGIGLMLKSGGVSSPHTNQDDHRLRLKLDVLAICVRAR